MAFDSHLTFIQTNATFYPQRLVFKLPLLEVDDSAPHQKILGWTDVTYKELYQDITWSTKYWVRQLQCPRGSRVGLWMSGMIYRDFVHLFGLIQAGFVPQILNLKICSVEIATEYFKQSNIIHVLHEPTAPVDQLRNHFQVHKLIDVAVEKSSPNNNNKRSIFDRGSENGEDTIIIFHTSGSTSGRPKLVPHTRKWIDGHSRKRLLGLPYGEEMGIAINGVVHLSQFAISLQQFKNGACVVLMPWLDFTGAELVKIITECKVNCHYQLSPILGNILREAMTNDELRVALISLKFIGYGGATFGDNERLWAIENGISLVNLYGSTEIGITMKSGCDPTILHIMKIPGLVHEFVSPDTEIENAENRVVELVVAPTSIDCPHPSLCGSDGRFHTRDLFEEVEPNGFIYRGRLDDIIKMSKGQKCDTSFIESRVLLSCKDMISVCVVVGSGRPSPVLLAEPLHEKLDRNLLKEKIGKKAELINKDGFPHERIRRSDILILPSGTLPRTPKGNINRSAAECLFKQEIDTFFEQE